MGFSCMFMQQLIPRAQDFGGAGIQVGTARGAGVSRGEVSPLLSPREVTPGAAPGRRLLVLLEEGTEQGP